MSTQSQSNSEGDFNSSSSSPFPSSNESAVGPDTPAVESSSDAPSGPVTTVSETTPPVSLSHSDVVSQNAQNLDRTDADTDEPPKKKLKITACNGREALQRVRMGGSTASGSRLSRSGKSNTSARRVKKEDGDDNGDKKKGGEKVVKEGVTDASGRVAKPRRRMGKLAGLVDLPLDVIYEIFSHLTPQDLLHLSRTTKDIRRRILSKNAVGVWKRVLEVQEEENEVPPCPGDMSPPAWASLVYEAYCHNCKTKNVRSVEWMLRTRLCDKCAKVLLMNEDQLDLEKKIDKLIRVCVPFQFRKMGKWCLISAKNAFVKELEAMEGDRDAFVEQRKQEVKELRKHASLCARWTAKQEKIRRVELNKVHLDRKDFIMEKLKELGFEQEFEFLFALENMTPGKLAAPIPHSVLRFNWHPEIKISKPLSERVWNNRVKAVMVKYMEGIRPHREANDRSLQKAERRRQFAEKWLQWRTSPEIVKRYRPGVSLSPSIADVLEMSCVEEVIDWTPPTEEEKEEWDGPFRSIADTFYSNWRPSEDPLPTFFEDKNKLQALRSSIGSWQLGLVTKFLEISPFDDLFGLYRMNIDTQVHCISLAICVFECKHTYSDRHFYFAHAHDPDLRMEQFYSDKKNRHTCLWFPDILEHGCARFGKQTYDEKKVRWDEHLFTPHIFSGPDLTPSQQPTGYAVHERRKLKRTPFNLESMMFSKAASMVVKNILTACGFHWADTTTSMMDKENPRVVCLKCSFGNRCDGERSFKVYTWRNAVNHALAAHLDPRSVQWERISDEDEKTVKRREWLEHLIRDVEVPSRRDVKCLLCWGGKDEHGLMTEDEMKEHLKTIHGKTDEQVNAAEAKGTLWFEEQNIPPQQPRFVITHKPRAIPEGPQVPKTKQTFTRGKDWIC
ncbi:hypothetical protein CC1G_14554 [Coprinopsis cinerea okayama7|uniref:F-box domain-containing protein n=1 Tax=Coprinopsis cinerea (strain Okayama-7 / 130 / ATCC MYA-4618 / FGSC 9003) TaxID=240176 RepID=D6RMG0_COPC7|nr:hypothetical protein CC1G_14554 [Coprinopsis cinerea okayama7\|eukprot:XP_002911122.1 hypothetical protein CC1G_14554 [Coprinopsis cinerea okayama7\